MSEHDDATMNDSDNPYRPPQSSGDAPPPRPKTSRLAWLLLETAVAVAIVAALVWLVTTGARP